MLLGNKLRKLRQDVGLSQTQVSSHFGWKTPQFVSNFERSLSYPPISSLGELADLYKVERETFKKMVFTDMLKSYRNDLKKKMNL